MNIMPTTGTIGDLSQMTSVVEELCEHIAVESVLNPITETYEQVVSLSGSTVFDDRVAGLLAKLKEIEERNGK